jgi:hypothetical protein
MSHKVVQIVPPPAPLLRIAKRLLICAGLIAVGYVGAQITPGPAGSIFAAGFRNSTSTAHPGPESPLQASSHDTPDASQRDFDYFPDHYRNQGKEAEPIDTF